MRWHGTRDLAPDIVIAKLHLEDTARALCESALSPKALLLRAEFVGSFRNGWWCES